MPLTKRSLALPPDPKSVAAARDWVTEVLEDIGRDELVFTAQLGVSELVTNALIHAEGPLTVRIRGTREHPRIEVVDRTPEPLHPTSIIVATKGDFPATFGRGLTIVAMNAAHWGSERGADGSSKTVWFEPSDEMHEDVDVVEIFRSFEDSAGEDRTVAPVDRVTIRLANVPAAMFAQLRRYHFELRREMRLLAFSDPDRYPIAVEMTDCFRVADEDRRQTIGVSRLDDAIERGIQHIDLEYAVPSSAPATMERALELLNQCYAAFAGDDLLAMAPPQELRELQAWYFTEFVRQGRGEQPTPWAGPERLASGAYAGSYSAG